MKNNNNSDYFKLKKSNLYKSAGFIGSVGVWYTIIGLIGIIIFLGIFLIIINFIYHKDWKIIQAEVLDDPKCYMHKYDNNNNEKTLKCDYIVLYEINNKKYKGQLLQKDTLNMIHLDDKKYINIEYNPNNPYDIDTIFPKTILNIIFGTLISILIITTIIIIIYRDNNVVKALTTINMARDIIKK